MEHKVSSEILQELLLLIESFGLGVVLMMGYDVVRFFRHIIKHKNWVVAIEDLLFWLVASISIFYLLYLENSGRVRLYAISGTALGMLAYYILWARRWMKWFDRVVEIVKKSWIFRKKG